MNSSDTDRIVDKVRKLLALAEGAATDGERDAALAQVQRLLDRYDLDQADIDAARGEDDYVEAFVDSYREADMPPQLGPLTALLRTYFSVKVISERRAYAEDDARLKLFGRPHHVQIAEYVYCCLDRVFREKWRSRVRATGHRRGARAYMTGLAIAVSHTLDQERARRTTEETTTLARTEHGLTAAFGRRYGELENVRRRPVDVGDGEALLAGLEQGQDIRIRPGVRSAEREQGKLFA